MNVSAIGSSLNTFWRNNENRLRQSLGRKKNTPASNIRNPKDQSIPQTLRDMTFIIAEISSHLDPT
jgi:hypothetical protein